MADRIGFCRLITVRNIMASMKLEKTDKKEIKSGVPGLLNGRESIW